MSSNTSSCFGFASVFVIVISLKCIDGWDWIADDLRGSNDVGGGRGGCKNCDWNELNEGGGGGRGCGGGIELLNGGGDGGEDSPLLLLQLLLLNLILLFQNAANLFCRLLSRPGVGAFLTRSLGISFFPMSSSRSKDPTIGFCASKVEISSNTS